MAAMREGATDGRYTCTRLPDGRVGARIDGWSRPVRDDVLDTRPHGTIDMHDGLVHSCNAYFAQLAVALGPRPLIAVADQLRIPLAADRGAVKRVRDTLPQVGFGQAQVVASPLRMATVAGIVAADGLLRQPYIEQEAKREATLEPVVDRAAARRLATYMRDVVLTGTGRGLRSPVAAGVIGPLQSPDK
jgi:peptidoglycan glycosyltransferase